MAYKVILADDERIILDGISQVINWEDMDTELVDLARNGIEAYEKIVRHQPNIVISDIKMPGMDGLSLVSKVHKEFPSIRFILLSGYSDFDYARTAMQYGVKNYLLKPCNEQQIMDALKEIIGELKEIDEEVQFVKTLRRNFERTQPLLKAQLVTELLTTTADQADLYQELIIKDSRHQQVRMVLLQLDGEFNYEYLFALKKIADEEFVKTLVTMIMGKHVLLIIEEDESEENLHERIKIIRERFYHYYKNDTTVALSKSDSIRNLRDLYLEAMECLNHRFYLGEGSFITTKDILPEKADNQIKMEFNEQQLGLLIKTGNLQEVSLFISTFFEKMTRGRLGIHISKSHIIQLYLAIVQYSDSESLKDLRGISIIMEMETIQQMKEFIENVVSEMTQDYFNMHKSKQSALIENVKYLVNKHYNNQTLSLKLVATEMLYMNADYLGKLFKQETGERFSSYLTRIRIEKAIEHIKNIEDVKIVTLAEMIGYGDNPQYFSQVFKKYTGFTPTEYREST